MAVRYEHFRQPDAIGAARLHPHCRIAAPIRYDRRTLLGDHEGDAGRLAVGKVRNDGPTEKVIADRDARGEGPQPAHDVTAGGTLELRLSGRPGRIGGPEIAFG